MSAVPSATYSIADFVTRWRDVKDASAQLEGPSFADRLALAEHDEPGTIDGLLEELGPQEWLLLAYDPEFWLRPKQLAPIRLGRTGTWRVFLLICGRGFGKTQTAAEWVVDRLLSGAREIVLAGPNIDDIKQFMVGGHKRRVDGGNGSGLLDVLPPWVKYHYREDDGVIEFPDFYAVAYLHSAEVPEFRGPNPDTVWGDEPIKWRYGERLLSNLRLACRAVGAVEPQILLTTSPKRLKLLRDLVMEDSVVTVHGRTDENRGNVHEGWFQDQSKRLAGTRQGDEELGGELEADDGSEMFPLGVIDKHRLRDLSKLPELERKVVAVDPAFSANRTSDEAGIVALGRSGDAATGDVYVLADETSKCTPDQYGDKAWKLLLRIGASAFVVENNHIGLHAASTLRAAGWRRGWKPVERKATPTRNAGIDLEKDGERIAIYEAFAKGDKASRADPVSVILGQGRIHFVGVLPRLEGEMSEWDPATSKSPNGLDAFVHGCYELLSIDRSPARSMREANRGYAEAVTGLAQGAGAPGATAQPMQDLLAELTRGHLGERL